MTDLLVGHFGYPLLVDLGLAFRESIDVDDDNGVAIFG